MSVLASISDAATALVDTTGDAGLAVVMAAEAVLPVPSEVVLPLVGSQVVAGQTSYLAAVVTATLGSTVGAWAVFAASRASGRDRQARVARIVGLDARRWARLQRWFDRHGDWAVLLSRLVPGIRVLVNLPAGSLGMPTRRFLRLTALGSALWNAAWIGAGSALTAHWDLVVGGLAQLLTGLTDLRPAVLLLATAGVLTALARQTRMRVALG